MKKNLLLVVVAVGSALAATKTNAQAIELNTGKTIGVVKHQATGMMYNTQTQRPVYIYIDPATRDTFYGRTGANINGQVSHSQKGYFYAGDPDYVYSDGEFRLKSEVDSAGYKKVFQRDGDVKVKYGDYKRKEEIDGDVKAKRGTAKMKDEADGTVKRKDGDYKKKIDNSGNVLIKDDTTKLKVNADGSAKLKDKRTDYKGKVDENGKTKEKQGDSKVKLKDDKFKVKTDEVKVKVTEDATIVKPQ
ncbi:MAG: hypothetical protein JWQ40_112 [Segetibacter sp.]|nr:hypothetical protein [Segetibacter sp.]